MIQASELREFSSLSHQLDLVRQAHDNLCSVGEEDQGRDYSEARPVKSMPLFEADNA
jgi:hypothetical protein